MSHRNTFNSEQSENVHDNKFNFEVDDDMAELGLDDMTSSKQWETITNCLQQMRWTDGNSRSTSPAYGATPASTSSTTSFPNVTAPRQNAPTFNHRYRKSDGDLNERSVAPTPLIVPSQSAPVLVPENYEFNWGMSAAALQSTEAKTLPGFSKSSSKSNVKIPQTINEPGASDHAASKSNTNKCTEGIGNMCGANMDTIGSETVVTDLIPTGFNKDANANRVLGNSHQMLTEISPLADNEKHSADKTPIYTKNSYFPANKLYSSYNLTPEMSKSYATSNKLSPSVQRKLQSSKSAYNKAMYSSVLNPSIVTPNQHHLPEFSLTTETHPLTNLNKLHCRSEDDYVNRNTQVLPDDKEYTKALLQHQRDRMNRLHEELQAKKQQLQSVVMNIQALEKQKRSRCKPVPALPSIQDDISKIREINRQLEIDCNCMYKEVDLFSRDGDNTREDFYFRYNRSSSIKPQKTKKNTAITKQPQPVQQPQQPHSFAVIPSSEPDEDVKWRCVHCTFDNHAALNKCEMCEFPRGVPPQSSRLLP